MPSSTLEGERFAALRLVRATKNRFGSTDEVGRVRDGRRRPARGRRPGPRVPRRSARGGARAASSRRRWRAAGRCSSRSRRSCAPPATARRPQGERHRPEPARRCSSPCSGVAPASAWRPRRLRQPRGRPDASPSRPSTCRSPSPSRRRCATGRSRPAPSRSARSGCSASCGRWPASSGGCARRRASASSGDRARGRGRGGRAVEAPGLEIVEVATLRDAVEAGLGEAAGSWRRRAGDARLTDRPASRGGRTGRPPRKT